MFLNNAILSSLYIISTRVSIVLIKIIVANWQTHVKSANLVNFVVVLTTYAIMKE